MASEVLRRIQITGNLQSILPIKYFLGLVEMTFGLVHASYSLPKWQAVKLLWAFEMEGTKVKSKSRGGLEK